MTKRLAISEADRLEDISFYERTVTVLGSYTNPDPMAEQARQNIVNLAKERLEELKAGIGFDIPEKKCRNF